MGQFNYTYQCTYEGKGIPKECIRQVGREKEDIITKEEGRMVDVPPIKFT